MTNSNRELFEYFIFFGRCRSWRHWVIRLLTGGYRVTHVSIGGEGVVLDLHGNYGVRFYPLSWYIDYHHWDDVYIIQSDHPAYLVDWDGDPGLDRKRVLAKHLTCGRYGYEGDCVSIAKKVLARIGVFAPRHITSPGALCRWLRRKSNAATACSTSISRGPRVRAGQGQPASNSGWTTRYG